MTKKKREIILVLILLAAASAGFLINQAMHRQPAARVEITVDGHLVQTLDLNQDADLIIDGANGGTNHLIIQNGAAWVSEASCPDKVCVHQGKVSMNGELIVCLPNRVLRFFRRASEYLAFEIVPIQAAPAARRLSPMSHEWRGYVHAYNMP